MLVLSTADVFREGGAFFGAILAGYLADKIGRKRSLMIGALIGEFSGLFYVTKADAIHSYRRLYHPDGRSQRRNAHRWKSGRWYRFRCKPSFSASLSRGSNALPQDPHDAGPSV